MNRDEAGFELTEHTADTGIRGWAPDLDGLFAVMARGLFSVITDPDRVEPGAVRRAVSLRAESVADLLHDWLEELNALHQIHGELYAAFSPHLAGETALEAEIRGEPLDTARHELRIEVKAVTWHGLRVEATPAGVEGFVLLDL